MKVYVIDPSNFTPYYDYALCRALRAAGAETTLATCRFSYEALPFAGDPCHEYRFFQLAGRLRQASARRAAKSLEYPADLLRLALRLARYRPDAVHFQWLLLPALELPLARWLGARGCRLVHTIHNLQPHSGAPLGPEYYRAVARSFDALIVHSSRDKSELDGVLGGGSGRVNVIPHGILFSEEKVPDRLAARQRLDLPPDVPLVLFFGLIEQYKGAHLLAKAMSVLHEAHPDAKLVIAGNPGSGFTSLVDALRVLDTGCDIFLRPGFVASADVAAYFGAADVVALPYLSASQSGVLMTAYRFGRPVVVTDAGGMGETVAGDQTGLVVAPGDATGLGKAIASLLSNTELSEAMSRNARRLATTRYDWSNIAEQTMALYRHQVGR